MFGPMVPQYGTPPYAPDPRQAPEPFTWGSGGRRMSADDIALQRRMAAQQIATGSDYSPIQHWTQGLARVANGLAGGLNMRRADEAAAEQSEAQAAILEALIGGDGMEGGGDPVAAALADPELRQLGMSVLESRQPKAPKLSEFGTLLSERDSLASDDPRRSAYDSYIAGKNDPLVTVTLPGGRVYVGPQSGLAQIMQGGQAPDTLPADFDFGDEGGPTQPASGGF